MIKGCNVLGLVLIPFTVTLFFCALERNGSYKNVFKDERRKGTDIEAVEKKMKRKRIREKDEEIQGGKRERSKGKRRNRKEIREMFTLENSSKE